MIWLEIVLLFLYGCALFKVGREYEKNIILRRLEEEIDKIYEEDGADNENL